MTSSTSEPLLQPLWNEIPKALLKDQWMARRSLRQLESRAVDSRWEHQFLQLQQQLEVSIAIKEQRRLAPFQLNYPTSLPIVEHGEQILSFLKDHQVLVIVGETGSGKTTQLPKFCLELGYGIQGKIGCTQPRRIAATSIAQRLSDELQSPLGGVTGYKIRFAEKLSDATRIQFMTDGILLAETQTDPFLNEYDFLIIDEAHERSLNIDFLLGFLKPLLAKRKELKLIITSADLETKRFSEAFDQAPVIEVSGRVYPVEMRYQPLPEETQKSDSAQEDHLIETLRTLLQTTWEGHILVFLPGEREIRDALQRLSGNQTQVELLPLYGRLPQKEQSRIFESTGCRKLILATNIAETSLTIPGIRYVVDSGLVRLHRYSSRNRTQQLQVEWISQDRANQRKGRAGRMEAGICIRLYSEEFLLSQRPYTDPEITRSSLSGVILRLLDLNLGEIETFPFIDRPSKTAISEGFKELKELGAIDKKRQLTPLGKQMAKFPLDPKVARVLLAARQHDAIREVLIIVSALSIHDPREIPPDREAVAKQAHKPFTNNDSDFITLFQWWEAYQKVWIEKRSRSALRQFCKQHFLSFSRMEEWTEVHRQLQELMQEQRMWSESTSAASYQSIHQALLTGYLHQIALRQEKTRYQTSGNRDLFIFPGSGVFQNGKAWIFSAVVMETSRLYARMVANIEVEWIEPVAKSLCHYHYSNPRFDEKSQRVLADEKVVLHGLVLVLNRTVSYGKIHPKEATALFIKQALLGKRVYGNFPFLVHNQALEEEILQQGAKQRLSFEDEVEQAAEVFYEKHLSEVFSVHDLNRILQERQSAGFPKFLHMEAADLQPISLEIPSVEQFPDAWCLGEQSLEIEYRMDHNPERDGVSIKIPYQVAPHLDPHAVDWLIPGHYEEKILCLLKALPKALRKQLIPVGSTAHFIASNIQPHSNTFLKALSLFIQQHYRLQIPLETWDSSRIPAHLQVQLKITDGADPLPIQGRQPQEVLHQAKVYFQEQTATLGGSSLREWEEAEGHWDHAITFEWDFDQLPQKIVVAQSQGSPFYGYPGLEKQSEGIRRRLFRTLEEARLMTQPALHHWLGLHLGPEMAWFQRDLRSLKRFQADYKPYGTLDSLLHGTQLMIETHLFEGNWIENRDQFQERIRHAQKQLQPVWQGFVKTFEQLWEQRTQVRQQLLRSLGKPSQKTAVALMEARLQEVLPPNFVEKTPYSQWKHLPRYLKALGIRAERMCYSIDKDKEKQEILDPYRKLLLSSLDHQTAETFRWLLEEFHVSLFAPELKTAVPISPKRLDAFLQQAQSVRGDQ